MNETKETERTKYDAGFLCPKCGRVLKTYWVYTIFGKRLKHDCKTCGIRFNQFLNIWMKYKRDC